jgi:hypothetical protein
VAARRRRSALTAASGSSQIAYHGSSQAVDSSSASIDQPAATRQSAPRAVRHSAVANTIKKPATYRWRHQAGVPVRPTSRAVSAGMLWVATSCCCSPSAFRNPSAWTPKPISPRTASAARHSRAVAATLRRSRVPGAASTRNGNTTPAVTFTPTPATSAAAPARSRGLAPAVSASASASTSMISVSLCAPPTASTSRTGFRPAKAAAKRGECPSRRAARAISATAPRLEAAATTFSAHSPPAMPSGAVA